MSLSVAKARRLKIPTLPNNRINLTRNRSVRFWALLVARAGYAIRSTKTMETRPQNKKEAAIWNDAVFLSLEWGEWWLKPINSRIQAQHHNISDDEAETLNKMAKEVQDFCFDLFQQEFDKKITLEEAQRLMKKKYPWLEERNLVRLQSQGMYYARK